MDHYTIAIDFDGTIVQHKYPDIGKLVPYAKATINMLARNGHQLFLWTMRGWTDQHKRALEEAQSFIVQNGIMIEHFNRSPIQFATTSPKQLAHLYIDDAALGCPVCYFEGCQVVDWYEVAEQLTKLGLLTQEQFYEIQASED